MAPSLDCSSLLCAEENDSVFYDDEGNDVGCGFVEDHWDDDDDDHRNRRNGQRQRAILVDFPVQSEECLASMILRESEHLPASDYLKRLKNGDLDVTARDEILDWISMVHAHFNFGPLCAYLAVNYLDRFLSAYELPKGKSWMMQLLAVACLSLAAKMDETEIPLSLDLQVGDAKFIFEARTIQRMELLVLSTLKWRMQVVTPFSFIDYFLEKINGDQIASSSSILKCIELILSTLKGIHFLEFRPSEIAAAVAISVAVETEAVDSEKAISSLIHHVQKDRVTRCVESIQEFSLPGGFNFLMAPRTLLPSIPHSPIGVLDAARLSYKTDDSGVESCENSSHNSPVVKRRKLNNPY